MHFNQPKFWKDSSSFLSSCLLIFSFIYWIVFIIKKKCTTVYKPKIRTICCGNLYVGGSGKTPLAIKIFKELEKKENCIVIKKNYSNQIDEINLLRDKVKLLTPSSRIEGIIEAEKSGITTAIFDDGLQDFSFKKDISILCINSLNGFGNHRILPAGPLRESLSSIKNVELAVINGPKNIEIEKEIFKRNKSIKIYYSKYVMKNFEKYLGKDIFAFSGIGNNDQFFDHLNKIELNVKKTKSFPDHYNYSDEDLNKILYICEQESFLPLTTEKDYFRLNNFFKNKINYIPVELEIDNYSGFIHDLENIKNI